MYSFIWYYVYRYTQGFIKDFRVCVWGGGGVCSRVIHEYAAQTIQIFKFSRGELRLGGGGGGGGRVFQGHPLCMKP